MDILFTLKKLLLSGFVVAVFIIYSFQQRHEDVSVAIAPSVHAKTSQSNSGTITPPASISKAATLKDGSYDGMVADAVYGDIQVQAIIRGGKISDIQFLQYPNDRRTSIVINQDALPLLTQEAIQAQTAHVDAISGATDTSLAFVESLSSALAKAQ